MKALSWNSNIYGVSEKALHQNNSLFVGLLSLPQLSLKAYQHKNLLEEEEPKQMYIHDKMG